MSDHALTAAQQHGSRFFLPGSPSQCAAAWWRGGWGGRHKRALSHQPPWSRGKHASAGDPRPLSPHLTTLEGWGKNPCCRVACCFHTLCRPFDVCRQANRCLRTQQQSQQGPPTAAQHYPRPPSIVHQHHHAQAPPPQQQQHSSAYPPSHHVYQQQQQHHHHQEPYYAQQSPYSTPGATSGYTSAGTFSAHHRPKKISLVLSAPSPLR